MAATKIAQRQADERTKRGMACWHEQHAMAFPADSDMRRSHTESACRLRAEALVKKWQVDCLPMADPADLQELEDRIAAELRVVVDELCAARPAR